MSYFYKWSSRVYAGSATSVEEQTGIVLVIAWGLSNLYKKERVI